MSPMIRGTDAQRAELVQAISAALRSCHGNLTRSADMLGVHLDTLRRYVVRLGLGGLAERERSKVDGGQRGGRPRKSIKRSRGRAEPA
jgi:DNA-binding NtrC family response regulator